MRRPAADCGRTPDGKFGDGNTCRIGININDSDQDFTGQILAGDKTSETRITHSLKPYVGKTVGIVRTGKGPATLVGTMKIGEPTFYKTAEEFDADFEKHRVSPSSPHYITKAGKFGYPLSEVKPVEPIVLKTKGIIGRVISDRDGLEEYDIAGVEFRSADCGRDEGGKFGSGNKCAGEGGEQQKEAVTKLRGKGGKQTDTARQMYSMGMTERKLASLIEKLGGSPKQSNVKSNMNRLNIHVADKSGNRILFIEFRRSGVRVYPTRELSGEEASKFESLAKEHFPKEYDKKGKPFKVTVFRDPSAIKDWEKENDAKYKAIEDKYATSVYLPPHRRPKKRSLSDDCRMASLLAFAESRNCGTGSGGFQKGNTCTGAVASDAAKGAAKGAVLGAAAGAAKTFSPQGAATGAAAGAVTGAIKGIYDNKMRPTRVSERIKQVGMTDAKVESLVKRLGGTPKSSAHTDGRNTLTIKVRSQKGKVTHVVDITDKKIVVYPRVAADRMSDKQISKIKAIAKASSPKETQVKVKTDSLAYVRRLAKKGIVVTGREAGMLVATVIVSGHAPLAGAAVMGTADLVLDTHFTDSFHKKRK